MKEKKRPILPGKMCKNDDIGSVEWKVSMGRMVPFEEHCRGRDGVRRENRQRSSDRSPRAKDSESSSDDP
ncbi:hypothetical protein CgunFtcFv8_010361 [Champsocephalus gunnari]|uniref:Uncharacterized protein n=1 Tax=Champsocephalus gunnari TaxID=52237 RepID=A0AAN8DVH8_CHAGU|nr:hypothetical protein CgunFtcFv8_010361 [Champsocephalus gunnari]